MPSCLTFPNVYQNYNPKEPCLRHEGGQIVERKGAWSQVHFKNDADIVLELGCGGGEYCLDLALQYPDKNFIGVDIKGNRIWKGARRAMLHKRENVAFLRTRIEQIDLFFAPGEVSEIWITFPDPFLKKSKANRRLTSPVFLRRYHKILRKGSRIHLKTDAPELYVSTLETLANMENYRLIYRIEDIYNQRLVIPELNIKTFYEIMHLADGKTIKYIQMEFTGDASDPDS